MSLILFAVLATTALAGCTSPSATNPSGSSTTSAASTTSGTSTTGVTPATKTVSASRLRTKRYCEVLLVRVEGGGATADVYNTFPLNACPNSKWAKLDPKAIAAKEGSTLAILNGPRYWLMDSIDKAASSKLQIRKTFRGIRMIRQATVTIGSLAAAKPYTLHKVDRSTVFTFDAGRRVYELSAPTGAKYVMHSWSQQIVPTLTEADLSNLGSRLQLPPGWAYGSRVLRAPLRIVTKTTDAEVLQDNLDDSYSLETGG